MQPAPQRSRSIINASGAVKIKLTPLLTPEDLDAAAKKSPSYRPPGG